jgi:hypothetical protein
MRFNGAIRKRDETQGIGRVGDSQDDCIARRDFEIKAVRHVGS